MIVNVVNLLVSGAPADRHTPRPFEPKTGTTLNLAVTH